MGQATYYSHRNPVRSSPTGASPATAGVQWHIDFIEQGIELKAGFKPAPAAF